MQKKSLLRSGTVKCRTPPGRSPKYKPDCSKIFYIIDEANKQKSPLAVCNIDLSKSQLKSIPKELYSFKNLQQLNLGIRPTLVDQIRSLQDSLPNCAIQYFTKGIILVAGHPGNNTNFEKRLGASGVGIINATSNVEAIQLLTQRGLDYDLVISDNQSINDGLQLLTVIRKYKINTPFFFYTAQNQNDIKLRVTQTGGANLITNDPATLDSAINSKLNKIVF